MERDQIIQSNQNLKNMEIVGLSFGGGPREEGDPDIMDISNEKHVKEIQPLIVYNDTATWHVS